MASLVPMNTRQAKTSPIDSQMRSKSFQSDSLENIAMSEELRSAYLLFKSRRGLVEKSILPPRYTKEEGYGKVPKYLQQCKMRDLGKSIMEEHCPANEIRYVSSTKGPPAHHKKNFVKAAQTQDFVPTKHKSFYLDWGGNKKVDEDSTPISNYTKKKGYGEVPQYLLQRKVKGLEMYLKKQQCLSDGSTTPDDSLPSGETETHLSNALPLSRQSRQSSQDKCVAAHSAESTSSNLTGSSTVKSAGITRKPRIFTRGDPVPLIMHRQKDFVQAAKEEVLVPVKRKPTYVDWNGRLMVSKDTEPTASYVKKAGYGEVPLYLKRKMREQKGSMKENGWQSNIYPEEVQTCRSPPMYSPDTSEQRLRPSDYGDGDTGLSLPTLEDDCRLLKTPSLEELPPVPTTDTPLSLEFLPNDSNDDEGESSPPHVDEEGLSTTPSMEELPLSSTMNTPAVEESLPLDSCEDTGVSLVVVLDDEDSLPNEESFEDLSFSRAADFPPVQQSPPHYRCVEAGISLLSPLIEEDSQDTSLSQEELSLDSTPDNTPAGQCPPPYGDTDKCDPLPAQKSSKNATKKTKTKKATKGKPAQGKNVTLSAKIASANVTTQRSEVEPTGRKKIPPVTRTEGNKAARKRGDVPHLLKGRTITESKEAERQRCPKSSTVKEKPLVNRLRPSRGRKQPNHLRPFLP